MINAGIVTRGWLSYRQELPSTSKLWRSFNFCQFCLRKAITIVRINKVLISRDYYRASGEPIGRYYYRYWNTRLWERWKWNVDIWLWSGIWPSQVESRYGSTEAPTASFIVIGAKHIWKIMLENYYTQHIVLLSRNSH